MKKAVIYSLFTALILGAVFGGSSIQNIVAFLVTIFSIMLIAIFIISIFMIVEIGESSVGNLAATKAKYEGLIKAFSLFEVKSSSIQRWIGNSLSVVLMFALVATGTFLSITAAFLFTLVLIVANITKATYLAGRKKHPDVFTVT